METPKRPEAMSQEVITPEEVILAVLARVLAEVPSDAVLRQLWVEKEGGSLIVHGDWAVTGGLIHSRAEMPPGARILLTS